mmetsp:Transcript_64287/g.177704  ORF Transcript_64287/g.177704 Transcript_64287/m.177704 type:complete len:203 (+) Transcript_64287:58-666(+)
MSHGSDIDPPAEEGRGPPDGAGHWLWGRVEAWSTASQARLHAVIQLEETSSSSTQCAEKSEGDGPQPGSSRVAPVAPARQGRQSTEGSVEALLEAALGDLWSRGSRKHSRGSCTVCTFIMGESGCVHGRDCNFCHIPHASAGRKKLGMRRRLKLKAFAEAIEAAYRDDLDKFRAAAAVAGSRCPFLEGLLFRKLEAMSSRAD